MDIMKVPTVHRNLGADKGSSVKFWEGYSSSKPPGSAILGYIVSVYTLSGIGGQKYFYSVV